MSNINKSIVVVKDVYKTFRLPHEQHNGIKQVLINVVNPTKRNKGYEIQNALNDISFDIKKGEFFGIVGRNGSGKSTLLKLLAGIYTPDKGLIHVDGTLIPFIELGVGFNPELTGRENVYLNGALLGLSRKETADIYDEVVEFAELEKFMDQKLKNYSSGMQVRLAFSIAIRAKGDILLIDEVLAVGDERFQQKCLSIFEKIKKDENKTVIFVSHDMQSVQKFCDRAMLIHDSEVKFIGDPNRAAIEYKKLNFPEMAQELNSKPTADIDTKNDKTKKIKITKFEAVDSEGLNDHVISCGKPFTFRFNYDSKEDLSNLIIGVGIKNKAGESIYGPNTSETNLVVDIKKGKSMFEIHITDNVFSPGIYTIEAGIFDNDNITCYDYISLENAVTFVGVERHGYAYVEPEWIIK